MLSEFKKSGLPKTYRLLALGFCFVLLVMVYFFVGRQIIGDEPHYLIADHAIVHHHTFDLKKVYLNHEYISYYPSRDLLPQGDPALISLDKPHVYPMHGIGLPLFLLPGYWLGSKNGAVLQMILLATITLYLVWVWCKRITGSPAASYIASAILLICYFFNGLSGYIYPDMLIAAISLVCLIILTGSTHLKQFTQLVLGLLLGFLIFIHYRNIDIAIPFLAMLSYKHWQKRHKLPWLSIAVFVFLAGFFLFSQYKWFGTWNPAAPYGALTSISSRPLSNISAMLFDSSRGLFIYNPALLLVFVGLPVWFKTHRQSLLETLMVLGPSMVVLSLFTQWTGGAAPTGRYIMAFLPAFIPALAFALIKLGAWWQRSVVVLLGVLTFLISLNAMVYKFPFVSYTLALPPSPLIEHIRTKTGLNLGHVLPSFTNDTYLVGKLGLIKLLFWFGVAGGLFIYGLYLSRTTKSLKTKGG